MRALILARSRARGRPRSRACRRDVDVVEQVGDDEVRLGRLAGDVRAAAAPARAFHHGDPRSVFRWAFMAPSRAAEPAPITIRSSSSGIVLLLQRASLVRLQSRRAASRFAGRDEARRGASRRRRGRVPRARADVQLLAPARRAHLRPHARARRGGRGGRRGSPCSRASTASRAARRSRRGSSGSSRTGRRRGPCASGGRCRCRRSSPSGSRSRRSAPTASATADDPRWPGHWAVPPAAWPEDKLVAAETREKLAAAIDALPGTPACGDQPP